MYKLVIYQRDISRKLDGLEDSLTLLRKRLPDTEWEIQVISCSSCIVLVLYINLVLFLSVCLCFHEKVVMHKKDRSPCELTHLLSSVDVLLTPHGFQSMLLLFLPRPAVLFEVNLTIYIYIYMCICILYIIIVTIIV